VRVRAVGGRRDATTPVNRYLERRGWLSKSWQTRKNRTRAGRPFTKTSLYRLLTNVVYAGKVRYKDEVVRHEA
jgi:site-specific DNA recombinase